MRRTHRANSGPLVGAPSRRPPEVVEPAAAANSSMATHRAWPVADPAGQRRRHDAKPRAWYRETGHARLVPLGRFPTVQLSRRPFLVLTLLLPLAACANDGIDAPSSNKSLPSAFEAELPQGKTLTASDIEKLLDGLNNGQPPATTLSAAAFDRDTPVPRTKDSEWVHFLEVFGAVRTKALDGGWSVLVEGYQQSSSKPVGTHDDQLSDQRAQAAQAALVGLGYPANRVQAIGRGVGGPNPSDRKVVISFVKATQ